MINFFYRNKKRLIIIGLFLAIYFGAVMIDTIAKKVLLKNTHLNKGVTKITLRHFVQPTENIFLHPSELTQFLDKIVEGKEGLLAWKPFYLILMLFYISLAVTLFLVIFK